MSDSKIQPITTAVRITPSAQAYGISKGGVEESGRGVLSVSEDSRVVYCPEPNLSRLLSFDVDYAADEGGSLTKVYSNTLEHLVRKIMSGQSSMVIAAGEDSMRKQLTIEGSPFHYVPGLATMAAEAIFREIEMDRAVGGGMLSYSYAVHFSWYQIKHEELHDVLLGAVEGASKAKLHMRDIPGQGVVVPDLWEVVIDTADALRELLVRVRDSLRQNRSSDGNDPHAHNVLTLKVVAMPVEEYRAGNRGGKGSSDTQPRVARLTFLTLANASEPPPKRGSSGGDQEEEDNKVAVWVRALHNALSAQESRSPSPPYHRSKVSLLMRDAMTSRMPATMLAVLSPDIDAAAYSAATLKFIARVKAVSLIAAGVDPEEAATMLHQGVPHSYLSEARGFDRDAPGPRQLTSLVSHGMHGEPESFVSHRYSESPQIPMSVQSRLAASPRRSQQERRQQQHTGPYGEQRMPSTPPAPPSPIRSPHPDGRSPAEERNRRASPYQEDLNGSNEFSRSRSQYQDPLEEAERVAEQMAALGNSGDESAKWFTAMLSALEVSRDETRKLRDRLTEATNRCSTLQAERDNLAQQIAGVQNLSDAQRLASAMTGGGSGGGGGSLEMSMMEANHAKAVRELRSKLKTAKQEVHDYELYKNVMETAVCRMQAEMARVVEEREAVQGQLKKANNAIRREKDQTLHWRKKAAELEKEVASLREGLAAQAQKKDKGKGHKGAVTHAQQQLSSSRLAAGFSSQDGASFEEMHALRSELEEAKAALAEAQQTSAYLRRQIQDLQAQMPASPQPYGSTPSARGYSTPEQSHATERGRAMVSEMLNKFLPQQQQQGGGSGQPPRHASSSGNTTPNRQPSAARFAAAATSPGFGSEAGDSPLMRAAALMARDVEDLVRHGPDSLQGAGTRVAAKLSNEAAGSRGGGRPSGVDQRGPSTAKATGGGSRGGSGSSVNGKAAAGKRGGNQKKPAAVTGRSRAQIAAFARARAELRHNTSAASAVEEEEESNTSSLHDDLVAGLKRDMAAARRG